MTIQFIDLESLCWEDGITPEGQRNAIIQVGFCRLIDNELNHDSKYILPRGFDWQVSPYCQELTGITQDTLNENGKYFPKVMKTIGGDFWAWGNDMESMQEELSFYGLTKKNLRIHNFAHVFQNLYGIHHRPSLNEALKHFGLTFIGDIHNAEWDAYNTGRVFQCLMKRLN